MTDDLKLAAEKGIALRLADGTLAPLLPGSIADDPQIRAAAEALEPILRATAWAVPNLLIFSRLGRQEPAAMLPPLRRLVEARKSLAAPSEELVERLAWQLHVDFRETARTVDELAAMTLNSIAWHRIKGTPAGIKRALALFGYAASIEEDGTGRDWATYQLGLPSIPDLETVRRIVAVCEEMAPARCRLWRMYTRDYDFRPGIWSGSLPVSAWSQCWWSLYSGTEVPGIPGISEDQDLIVSFGSRRGFQAEGYAGPAMAAGLGWLTRHGMLAPYLDRDIWGRTQWSDVWPQNHGFTSGQIYSLLWAERRTVSFGWIGLWDARRWLDVTGWDRKLPLWSMGDRQWSRSEAVWSWPEGEWEEDRPGDWSALNSCYGIPRAEMLDAPPLWGASLWSDDAGQPRRVRLHELRSAHCALGSTAVEPGRASGPGAGMPGCSGTALQPLHNQTWSEQWDTRRWQNYVGYLHCLETPAV